MGEGKRMDEFSDTVGELEDLEMMLAKKLFNPARNNKNLSNLTPEEREVANEIQNLLMNKGNAGFGGVSKMSGDMVGDYNEKKYNEGKLDEQVGRGMRPEVVISKLLGMTNAGQDSIGGLAAQRDSVLNLIRSKMQGPKQSGPQ
jgi:hypothetical protein